MERGKGKVRGQVVGQGRCRVRVHPPRETALPTKRWSRLDRDAFPPNRVIGRTKRRTIVAGAKVYLREAVSIKYSKLDSFRRRSTFIFPMETLIDQIPLHPIEVQLILINVQVSFVSRYIQLSVQLSLNKGRSCSGRISFFTV